MPYHARRSLLIVQWILLSLSAQAALAVVPYRAPQDEAPSIAARAHLAACRVRVHGFLEAQAEHNGSIENEAYVQHGNGEYFRFLVRNGGEETVLICDASNGEIRRTIRLWEGL